MKVTNDQIDSFVDDLRKHGKKVYWENYTLCVFVPDSRGQYSNKGRLLDDRWGFEHRFEIGNDGCWTLSQKVISGGVKNA